MIIIGLAAAIACWFLALWNAYRRSSERNKNRGLLITFSWLVLITPIAAYRLGNNLLGTEVVAAAGGLLFAALTWKRGFDLIEQDRKKQAEAAEAPMGKGGWGCLIVIAGYITFLVILVLLH